MSVPDSGKEQRRQCWFDPWICSLNTAEDSAVKMQPTLLHVVLASTMALSAIPAAHASLIGTGYSAVGAGPVSVTTPSVSTNAGSFVGTWNALPFFFWCFELTEYFYFNVEYFDYTESPVGYSDVARLFEAAGGAAGATSSLVNSVAFQLAVWEIRYETLGTYNLAPGTGTSGSFYTTSADGAAVAQANQWLQHLPDTSTYSISLLHSGSPGNEQDFVYATSRVAPQVVPEPAPIALVGIGLAAMVFSFRRRARQS